MSAKLTAADTAVKVVETEGPGWTTKVASGPKATIAKLVMAGAGLVAGGDAALAQGKLSGLGQKPAAAATHGFDCAKDNSIAAQSACAGASIGGGFTGMQEAMRQPPAAKPAGTPNPFDTPSGSTAQGLASPTATSRLIKDNLPGLPVAPKGAVVADLTSHSNDPEVQELARIVAEMSTPQFLQRSMKPAERSGDLYKTLADFLNKDRTPEKRAEMIGRAAIMVRASSTLKPDGTPKTMQEVFANNNPLQPTKIYMYPELAQTLLGKEPPTGLKNSFSADGSKLHPMKALYKVHLVQFARNANKGLTTERIITFNELLDSAIGMKDANGTMVPAATSYGNNDVGSTLMGLGFRTNAGDVAGAYKMTYKNPKGGSETPLFDLGELKLALQGGNLGGTSGLASSR